MKSLHVINTALVKWPRGACIYHRGTSSFGISEPDSKGHVVMTDDAFNVADGLAAYMMRHYPNVFELSDEMVIDETNGFMPLERDEYGRWTFIDPDSI